MPPMPCNLARKSLLHRVRPLALRLALLQDELEDRRQSLRSDRAEAQKKLARSIES